MNETILSDMYPCIKLILCGVVMWIAASISACGVKAGDAVVFGTTSFLEEVNRGAPMDHHTPTERAQLAKELRRY